MELFQVVPIENSKSFACLVFELIAVFPYNFPDYSWFVFWS